MKQEIIDRIDALRLQMKKAGITATIIPQTDPHQGEYLASHFQVRRFLSGFTGSAGTLVVTPSEALLWTDSRYFIQGAAQLEGTGIKLMKEGLPATPGIADYLVQNLTKGSVVGIDGWVFSVNDTDNLRKTLEAHGLSLKVDADIINAVWTNRPSLPNCPAFVHDNKYAGRDAADKIKDVLGNAKMQGADSVFISALDEIAWILNIRSRDVNCNPVAISFLYISPKGSTLF
ncbi:MAG: aminopeptidase P family N-terminal domain-containing protein, partial [Muribaculaceae bacterium]|nr:aminopeptidase P family N-terminal domain-containing protein [Muribaculaceae bacterium]